VQEAASRKECASVGAGRDALRNRARAFTAWASRSRCWKGGGNSFEEAPLARGPEVQWLSLLELLRRRRGRREVTNTAGRVFHDWVQLPMVRTCYAARMEINGPAGRSRHICRHCAHGDAIRSSLYEPTTSLDGRVGSRSSRVSSLVTLRGGHGALGCMRRINQGRSLLLLYALWNSAYTCTPCTCVLISNTYGILGS
jgi:hypothetical protein